MASSVKAAAPTALAPDTRPSVTVLSGFYWQETSRLGAELSAAHPDMLLVSHDTSRLCDNVVRRVVTSATQTLEEEDVTLDHGCLSCTVHEDVLPTLARLARQHKDRDVTLLLPPSLEPSTFAAACHYCEVDGQSIDHAIRLDSIVAVVDARHFLDDLETAHKLSHRGMAAADNDDRAVADLVARQVECADTVVLSHSDADSFEHIRLTVLLHRMVPWAVHLTSADDLAPMLRRTRRFDPDAPDPFARALEGYEAGVDEPVADCGVSAMVFRSRRPFHPRRLHDRLSTIAGETLRGRGNLWLASQPEHAVAWESAGGGLSMGSLGWWLECLPETDWSQASERRRAAAALEWDPYYGDRHCQLAFVGMDFDAAELRRLLQECLLTDHEIAEGQDSWREWDDPFAESVWPPDIVEGGETEG